MTDLQLTAAITHEGDWYVARCLQVEVTSQGETVESAPASLREALELYFEDEPLPADAQLAHHRTGRDLHPTFGRRIDQEIPSTCALIRLVQKS